VRKGPPTLTNAGQFNSELTHRPNSTWNADIRGF